MLAAEVLQKAQARTEDLGIEILDFRFKRLNYVEEVRVEVYARMISERQRIAEQFRSEGAGEAARINGERERDLQQITSEAYRQAQEVKGRADAEAAGLTGLVEILDNGSDAPGTILEDCTEAFRSRFMNAGMVVAKGQGNYETLSDAPRPVWFVLMAKCEVIARHIGCEPESFVLQRGPAVGSG